MRDRDNEGARGYRRASSSMLGLAGGDACAIAKVGVRRRPEVDPCRGRGSEPIPCGSNLTGCGSGVSPLWTVAASTTQGDSRRLQRALAGGGDGPDLTSPGDRLAISRQFWYPPTRSSQSPHDRASS